MITRGSRVFFSLALAAYGLAVVYGVITNGLATGGVVAAITGDGAVDAVLGPISFGYKGGVGDHVGYSLLIGFALASLFAGAVTVAFRDGDPEAVAELANADAVPPVAAPADLSPWPIVGALGAGVVTLGLATEPAIFIAGLAIVGIAMIEWTVKAWSEQATGDPEVNRLIRKRLMHPVELPVAGLLIALVAAVSISQVFLTSSKTAAWVVASILAATVLVGAVMLSLMPEMKRSILVGVAVAVSVLVIGLGIFGAVRGAREFEKHESGGEHSAGVVDSARLVPLGETS